jgi:hypothetical protein
MLRINLRKQSHAILIVKFEYARRVVVVNWQSQGTSFGVESPPLPPASEGGPKRPLSLNKIPGVAYIGEVRALEVLPHVNALSRDNLSQITRAVQSMLRMPWLP